MECVSVMGKCRACCIKTQKEFQIPIFTRENLLQIFREVTSLEIHENDKFPGILCEECHSRLLDAHKFRQMCFSSALALQKILSGECDSDFEDKYKPPELVDVSGEEEHNCGLSEEKFNPLESFMETTLVQGEDILLKSEKSHRKTSLKKEKKTSGDPLGSHKDDDPDWNAKKTPRIRKQSKNPPKPRNPRKKKQGPPSDVDPGEVSKAKGQPDNVLAGKSKRECALCGKKYIHKSNLKWHMRIVHQGLKEAKCEICSKEFTRSYCLETHMMVVHGTKEIFRCLQCRIVYRTKEGLENHMKKWHDPHNPKEKPKTICELCGKTFASNAALMRHTSSHTGIRPFKCTLCPRAYNRKHRLKVHMMGHEGIKNHVCTVCGLRKTTQTELKTHMNIHTKERIFTCEFCSRTFLKRASLTRHIKVVHQGIKAFPCPHCERSFGKKETLKHHVMTHTGEKPHVCNICSKRFIQPTALQTHMKTHQKCYPLV